MTRRFAPLLALAAMLVPGTAHAAEISKHSLDAVADHIRTAIGCEQYESHKPEISSLYCTPRQGVSFYSRAYASNDGTVNVTATYAFKVWNQAELDRAKADLRTLLEFMFPGDAATVDRLVADFANTRVAWRDCGTDCDAFISKSVAIPGFEYALDLIYK